MMPRTKLWKSRTGMIQAFFDSSAVDFSPVRWVHDMRSAILGLGFTVLSAALATTAPAQTGAEDAGIFEIQVNGRGVGQEEFSLRQTGVGPNAEFVANGRVQVVLPAGSIGPR